jgi:hypothetical protein
MSSPRSEFGKSESPHLGSTFPFGLYKRRTTLFGPGQGLLRSLACSGRSGSRRPHRRPAWVGRRSREGIYHHHHRTLDWMSASATARRSALVSCVSPPPCSQSQSHTFCRCIHSQPHHRFTAPQHIHHAKAKGGRRITMRIFFYFVLYVKQSKASERSKQTDHRPVVIRHGLQPGLTTPD